VLRGREDRDEPLTARGAVAPGSRGRPRLESERR
jgi:hypothetical protein